MSRYSVLFYVAVGFLLVLGCGRAGEGGPRDTQSTGSNVATVDRTEASAGLTSVPLGARRRAGATQFQSLAAEETGVDFASLLKASNNLPYLNIGCGVAIGDYDRDGWPDLYLTSTDGPNRLYRQVGPLKFEDVTGPAGVDGGQAWSRGATFVDIDNDDDLDLYVCNTEAPNLLYINQGDGSFREAAQEYGLDHVAACVMAYFSDYDRDGDLDVYLLTHRVFSEGMMVTFADEVERPADTATSLQEMLPLNIKDVRLTADNRIAPEHREHFFKLGSTTEGGKKYLKINLAGQRDVLLRNDSVNGSGRFTDVTEQAGVTDYGLGLSATWMDFDCDGHPDLHVANDLYTRDRLYRNQGDGTFTEVLETMLPHTPWFSMGADFADINNDGRFDFLVADMSGSSHYRAKIFMGNMQPHLWFLNHEWPRQAMRNALYLGTGTSRYLEAAHMCGLDSTDWTWAVRFADLDNDGHCDAFFTNGFARDIMNPDRYEIQFGRILNTQGVQAAVSHMRDIPPLRQENLAFRNAGNLRFENTSATWGLNHHGISHGAACADLDRDGDLDLVVNNLNEPVSIYRNDSAQGHGVLFRLVGVSSNRYGLGTKLTIETGSTTQIRQLSPTRGFMSADEPLVHFGLGDEESVRKLTVQWTSGRRQIFTNLPADRLYTITEAAGPPVGGESESPPPPQFEEVALQSGLDFIHSETLFDDYQLQPLLPGKLSQLGPGLAFGDVDGDGDDDLFVGGAAGQSGALFINGGRGTFERATEGPWKDDRPCEDMAPLWIDIEGDGDLDLLVTSGGVEHELSDRWMRDRLYVNDGQGNFTKAPDRLLSNSASSGCTAAADFDSDGDLDLFVGVRVIPGKYPLAPTSQLLRNDEGQFTDVSEQLAPDLSQVGLVTSALWSDVDNDGRPDLLLTLEWGAVKLFRNVGGKLEDQTEVAGLSGRTGWWNSITGGDFDGDDDIDYVVMNVGLNTKYGQPTPERPTAIFYGDMEGDQTRRLVEAKNAPGGMLPVRGRSCSSRAMPFLAEKFPTYHDFASALLPQIYTPQCLQDAQQFTANHFQSGLLMNDGTGRFQWQDLPRLAQISPGFGVVATDLDADGLTDIYAVQNLFSREPETGVWRGGLGVTLFGKGLDGPQLASPARTGLIVDGDAKGLAVTDLDQDGWPDLVVTQNNDRMLAFRNQGVVGRRPFTVRLQGPPGNPQAIGARVTLITDDEQRQVAEIYAGSGYLSQSTPTLFFGTDATQTVTRVQIRWPDGKVSRHVPPVGNRQIQIPHPDVQ